MVVVIASVSGGALACFLRFLTSPWVSTLVRGGTVGSALVVGFRRSDVNERYGAALGLRTEIGRKGSEGTVGVSCDSCGADQAVGLCGRAIPSGRLGVVLAMLSEDDGPRDVVGVVFSPVDDTDEIVLVSPKPDDRRNVLGREEDPLLV